ncbi:transposase domain-containing protein [Streptomyces sp. NPDC002513]
MKAPLSGQSVIPRKIAAAAGVLAPGGLGELTRIAPFELVDAVPAECGAVQQRLRKLPARVVVHLLLAAALFEKCGYQAVWARLTTAQGSLPIRGLSAPLCGTSGAASGSVRCGPCSRQARRTRTLHLVTERRELRDHPSRLRRAVHFDASMTYWRTL